MATVYLAQDRKLGRAVALKVLRPELAAALGSDRFLREIEIAAKLTHPHVLGLHDCGEADGFLYYTMPFVQGESLRDRLSREKQLPLDDALQIAREVADALGYAHALGLVHRDIKPENILFESGHAVVSDFGIARAVSAAGGARLTETGLAIGTPAYMSPEQAAGSQDVDGRSDLYSLGCVLYEMLSGETPYTGPSAQAILAKKLSEPLPRISVVREAVPAGVEAALTKALARTPADRYMTAAQFAGALAHPEALFTPVPAAKLRWWSRRAALLGLALVVIVAGAVALGRWLRVAASSRHPRTAIAVLPLENLSAGGPYAYFAGGLHGELLTQLAKVAALSVRARTSVTGYAGTTKTIKQIGDELAVGTVVEGSVQVVGDRLRVNVQLIDTRTDAPLWAERYDSTLDDAFAVQSAIARRIVDAVGATLTTAEAGAIAAAPTTNPEAYRFYLHGEEYLRRPGFVAANFDSAQRSLERALAVDSGFALAHASLSEVHSFKYILAYDPTPEGAAAARSEAETALRLAPTLPQAITAMGWVYAHIDHDYRRALGEFRRASELMPGSAELWSAIGFQFASLGEWAEWQAAYQKAIELNPRDASLFFDLGGNTLWQLHRYQEALAAMERALVLAPDVAYASVARGFIYVIWRGQLDTLRAVLDRGPESFGPMGSALYWRVRLALWERRPDQVLALIPDPRRVVFEWQDSYEPAALYAGWAHQLRGDGTAARSSFEAALVQLDSALRGLQGDYRLRASRGLALANLGRRAQALREAEWLRTTRACNGCPGETNLRTGRAKILAQLGMAGDAVAALEPLLNGPSWYVSVSMLRLDPLWDPIRTDPRFQALLRKYGG